MRVTKDGKVGNSRPCNNCIQILSHLVYRVYYTTKDGSIKCEKMHQMIMSHISVGNRHVDNAIQTILSNKTKLKTKSYSKLGSDPR